MSRAAISQRLGRVSSLAVFGAVFAFGACGGKGPFALTASDNDPNALQSIIAGLDGPTPGPLNRAGKPIAVVSAPKTLSLIDLTSGKVVWTTSAAVDSRVSIGKDIAVAREGQALVARDLSTGSATWSHALSGELIGHSTDANGVLVTTKSGKSWTLTALSPTGDERWAETASGVLGAPVASRGVAFVPFLNQWLSILDARTGKSLTRVRAVSEKISFVRRRGADVLFGSATGAFLFDVRAASGSPKDATYASAKLPKLFNALRYDRDAYDEKQADYTALDQRHIVWSARADGNRLRFGGGQVAVHYYRFIFSFDAESGELRWAYNHPRLDLVSAQHLGETIAAIASDGTLVVLDAATGALKRAAPTGVTDVRGAAFDAEQFRLDGAGTPGNTEKALAEIAFDRDARFAAIKTFAISSLGGRSSPAATSALIDIARRGGAKEAEQAAAALIKRGDPSGAAALVAEVESGGACLAICARALAAIAPDLLEPTLKQRAQLALLRHFSDPGTTVGHLAAVALALGGLADAEGIAALRQFYLVHRADPSVAESAELLAAMSDALAVAGGAARAAVVFVAGDPVTAPAVASDAQRALAK